MRTCAIACALFFLSFHANAQTYLECDFSNGIPSDFTLIDNDGNTPSADMQALGFETGKAWISLTPNNEKDLAACSTSYYTPGGQSDDWMITPQITVSDDNVVLRWRAKASDRRYRDGYAVYVSESGSTSIDGFDKNSPLFSVAEEESSWTTRSVSLDQYKGKTITIAFVNNSNDKSRLYVDDLFIGAYSKLTCKLDLGTAVARSGEVTVSGEAHTDSSEPVNGFTVGLEYDGNTYTQDFDLSVTSDSPQSFVLDKKIEIAKDETVPYTVWIESDGSRYSVESDVTSYPRKMVGEELTGTWCSWCVRGIVALETMKKNYSDIFIGIAAHSGDVMASDYISELAHYCSISGLPAAVLNREYSIDPGNFEQYTIGTFDEESVYASVSLSTTFNPESREVSSTTTLRFADDYDNATFALAYAIIENDVHKPGDSQYDQNNAAYSGGGSGEMGGYENKPATISSEDMYYQEVARGYVDDFDGIDGSVPSEIKANETIEYGKTFTLPDNILDDQNAELVVMLVDKTDGHIVNAEIAPIGSGSTGIDAVKSDVPAKITGIFSIDGHKKSELTKGVNIIKTSDGKTKKIIVR